MIGPTSLLSAPPCGMTYGGEIFGWYGVAVGSSQRSLVCPALMVRPFRRQGKRRELDLTFAGSAVALYMGPRPDLTFDVLNLKVAGTTSVENIGH
jgi:hypothetical protein